jgi:2-amino-4-hydroxy-6-hydroxymethyldihydropteridine diphosphokinase
VTRLDTLEKQAKDIFLGIGSNIGNRINNIERAKSLLLENNINLISISSYYETPSWPDPKNPKFINIVLKVRCTLDVKKLLSLCKNIELKLGRKKSPKNSPRECDIDIIDFNGLVQKDKIYLPHKMMHKRNFVLFPLFEIEKNWVHPILKKDIKDLILSLSNKEIRTIKQI